MSFSSQIKNELLNIKNENSCCDNAQNYGLLLFGRSFSASEVSISTENKSVASCYKNVLNGLASGCIAIRSSSAGKVKIRANNKEDALRIVESFGYSGKEKSLRLNWSNFNDTCCHSAFIRGAFLSCGSITSPEKGYHLEFSIPYLNLCKDFKKLMNEAEIFPKQLTRNGYYILYFKDSEAIEDILTLMGAVSGVLEFMGVKMYKDMRNNVNRRTNFENANLDRTVGAEIAQKEAINKIINVAGINSLPPELRDLAKLRIENDGLSLRDLGMMTEPPLSRSGVNHRLKKIIDIAEGIK